MPVLTREEAQTRALLLDIHRYEVDLDLTRGDELFGSTTVIHFTARQAGDTFVELRPAALHLATLDGRPLDPAALDDNRLPLTGLTPGPHELRVEADMRYSRTGEGMHRFTDPADGETYLYTQAFLEDVQRVFAAFDQPDLKAVLDATVTAPPAWTVLGNAVAERVGDPAEGRWRLATTQPLSTYFIAFAAGPWHSVRTEHAGLPFALHCRRSLAAHLDADAEEILDITRRCFDRYHEIFDEPYPFDSYDQAFVPEFNAGAMENPGLVTFRDEFVFHSAVTDTERQTRGVVIAHEMAHMWFGDLVTLRWWDDIWLNESFAEYMGYQVLSEATRFTGTWTDFAVARKGWGYDADQRPSTHPVAPEPGAVHDTASALLNFDGISYAKGASALRQLVAWLGEKDFLAGINDHFTRHRFGNATLADFLDSLARSSTRDVHAWADTWLRTSGVDTLTPRVDARDEEPPPTAATREAAAGGATGVTATGATPAAEPAGAATTRPAGAAATPFAEDATASDATSPAGTTAAGPSVGAEPAGAAAGPFAAGATASGATPPAGVTEAVPAATPLAAGATASDPTPPADATPAAEPAGAAAPPLTTPPGPPATTDGTWRLTLRHDGTRPHHLTLGLYDTAPGDDHALLLRDRVATDLPAGGGTRTLELPGRRPDLLLLNDGDLTYAKVRLDAASWDTALRALSGLPDALGRAVLWNAARDMVRDGELAPAAYLDAARAHLPYETDTAITGGVLAFARHQIADRYVFPAARPAALALLADLCRDVLARTESTAGGDSQGIRLTAVRTLVDSATDPGTLHAWLREGTVPGGPALDAELRWRILHRLAVLGATTPAALDAELARDPSATGREGAARCHAALPDAAAKEAAWQAMYGRDDLSNYLFTATAQGFWQPEQLDLVRPYRDRYHPAAVALATRRGPALASLAGGHGFPSVLVEERTRELGEECLRTDGPTPALRRKLADQLDDLDRALRIRAAQG
ncbi:aminopeptidase N [Streptomyces sp. HU2014]|uniref:aminopeptidase N n=1 Tax=Streptomyces sp. HU2014 TaxID=2939414 RepID=UPI00200BE04F|nr:aminopeptidase N [Streptomyces sp. HU2014]UQI44131.1 aminopeptidase N [Streptomyces sp. HU2014]